jgi:hypothetical protein
VWGVARPENETCKTNQITGAGGPRLRIGGCGLEDAGRGRSGRPVPCLTQYSIFPLPPPQPRPERKRAKRTQFGPGRRRLTDETVQNKVKLGETGVCEQRQLSCGAWLGRRPDAQNEPNLRRISGLKSQVSSRRSRTRHALTSNCTFPTSNFLGNALRRHYERGNRAKRTQFAGRAERRCFPGSATQSSIILHQSSIAQNCLWRAGVECGRIAR